MFSAGRLEKWRILILQLFVPSQTFYQAIRSRELDPKARPAHDAKKMETNKT